MYQEGGDGGGMGDDDVIVEDDDANNNDSNNNNSDNNDNADVGCAGDQSVVVNNRDIEVDERLDVILPHSKTDELASDDKSSSSSQHQRNSDDEFAALFSSLLLKQSSSPPGGALQPESSTSLTGVTSGGAGGEIEEFHCSKVQHESLRTLHDFQRQGYLCDLTIVVGDRTIPCHRTVLACCSEYFRAMFRSDMRETHRPEVHLKELDEESVAKLTDFAYTGKLQITVDNVQQLLYTGLILQMQSVVDACGEFMVRHLHPTNCLDVHAFAEQHNHLPLTVDADRYICQHFTLVVNTPQFLKMKLDHVLKIINDDGVNVNNELCVFAGVMMWVLHDFTSRRHHLLPLVTHIRLAQVTLHQLVEVIEDALQMCHDAGVWKLLAQAKNYHLRVEGLLPNPLPHLPPSSPSSSLSSIKSMASGERLPPLSTSPFHKLASSSSSARGVELWDMCKKTPRISYAGVIFCVGGRGRTGDPYQSVECYDLMRDKWVPVANMLVKRRHVGVCAFNDKIYAVGGHNGSHHLNTAEVYDPKSNDWATISSMECQRRGIAVTSIGEAIYAVGGLDDSQCFSIVERYDVELNTWTKISSMSQQRGGVAAASLNGCIYACGGNDSNVSLDSCECYDPVLNRWSTVSSMNYRRAGAGLSVLGGHLYAMGGFDDNAPLYTAERYDSVTGTWQEIAPMQVCRGGVGTATIAGQIIAIGGHDGNSYLKTVEAYDPVSNTWRSLSSISICRAGAGVAWSNFPITSLISESMDVQSCV